MSTQPHMDDVKVARAAQAVDWFLRLGADDVTEEELAEWLRWCGDSANANEFRRTRATWAGFGQLQPEAEALLDRLLQQQAVPGLQTPKANKPSPRWYLLATAATLGCLSLAGIWFAHRIGMFAPQKALVVAADADRSAVLPDGSTLALAPKTDVAVDFSGPLRNLALSHGQAFFKVRPDKSRPFVVKAGSLSVTAVGTAFDVRSETGRVVVTVQEGIVEVISAARGQIASQSWRVTAGYQIAYNDNPGSAQIRSIDPGRAAAWRGGRLEYFGEPLSAVVADINRYSSRSIEVGDPRIANLSYTGTVFTSAIDDWLGAIQATFPVQASVGADNRVVLTGRTGYNDKPR